MPTDKKPKGDEPILDVLSRHGEKPGDDAKPAENKQKPGDDRWVWYQEVHNDGRVVLVFRMKPDWSVMERYDWKTAKWVDASERLGTYLVEGSTDLERTYEEAAMQAIKERGTQEPQQQPQRRMEQM